MPLVTRLEDHKGAKDKTIDAVTVGNDAVYSEPAFDPNCAERFRVGRIASSWAGGRLRRRDGAKRPDGVHLDDTHDDFGPFGTSVATQLAHLDVCSIEAMLTREMEPGDFTPVVQIVDFAANRNGRTYRLLVSDGSWFNRCIGSLKLVEEGQLERGCIVRVDNFRIDAEGFEKPTILLEKLTVVRAPCGLVGLPTSYPDRKIMPPLSLAKLPDWDTSNPDAFFCTATDIVALAFATPAHLVVAEADARAAWAEHRHHCPASSSFAAGQATPAASRPDDGEATDGEAAPPPPRETDGAAPREIRVHVSVNGAIVKTEVCDFSKYPLDVPISRVTDAFPASVSAIQTLDGAPLPETTRAAEILERHGGDVVLILDFASIITART
ncbi:hypothetical protein JL721_1770 [Aureococcus anophagefferens]|nr:hypothetical protein JL721_1770 [Aureococcus anophagefferens]